MRRGGIDEWCRVRQITIAPTFDAWQEGARRLLREGAKPEDVVWEELFADQPPLVLFEETDGAAVGTEGFRVPKGFVEIARRVACHHDPRRWALLYRVLWRLTHEEPRLLEIVVDPDIDELARMDKAVRHDVHKMRAFVRFRRVGLGDGSEWYVAWFEPEHQIVQLNAPFFTDRFAAMCWSILTPTRCVHWDGAHLSYTEGVRKSEAPDEDTVEALWLNYYAHIFNPARVKTHAMEAEMPKRYWKNLPETAVIPALLNEAPARVSQMIARSTAQQTGGDEWHPAPVPATRSTLR